MISLVPEAAPGVKTPTLRGYQTEQLCDVEDAYEVSDRLRVMMQAETGSGKTMTASGAARRLISDKHIVIGWLTDRDELREQSASDLRKFRIPVVLARSIPAARREWRPGRVTVFSPTMRMPDPPCRERDEYGDPVDPDEPIRSFLIVDEAHHSLAASWRDQIEAGWDAVLGLTATPWHLRVSADYRDVWDELVTGPTYNELVDINALCDYEIVYPSHGAVVKRSTLLRDTSGEFTNESVTSEIMRLLATDAVFEEWYEAVELLEDQRTLLFAPTVPAAEQAAHMFNDEGVAAAVLHAKTPKAERKRIVQKFRRGQITVLSNVAVATEGFDCPAAAVVLMLRPTSSLGLHRQMIGRALRPSKGKDRAVIIDLAGNTVQHGGPDREIEWSLAPRGRLRSRRSAATPCPYLGCRSVNHVSSNQCRSCDGQLLFRCGRCFRQLLYTQYTHEIVESDPPQIKDDCVETEDIHDGLPCRECSQVYADDAARLRRLLNGSVSSDKWRQRRRDTLSGRSNHAKHLLKTSRKMPGWEGQTSVGTLFEWDANTLMVSACPVFTVSFRVHNGFKNRKVRGDKIELGHALGPHDASEMAAKSLLGMAVQ